MVGVEYVLAHIQPPVVFVIRKQERRSPTETLPLEYFFIVEGSIYKAPTLYDVVGSRLTTVLHHLQQSLDKSAQCASFQPDQRLYKWRVADGQDKAPSALDDDQSTVPSATGEDANAHEQDDAHFAWRMGVLLFLIFLLLFS